MEELDPAFLNEETVNNNSFSFSENESNQEEFLNDSFNSDSYNSFGSTSKLQEDDYSYNSQGGSPSRRGSRNNRNGNLMNSLAFELENVGSASRSSTKDIIAELGIDEDEEGGQDEEDYDSEEESREEEEMLHQQQQSTNEFYHNDEDRHQLSPGQSHVDRYKLSPFRSTSSASSSTSISHSHFETSSPSIPSSPPTSKDDLDSSFLNSISAFETDLGSTSSFLQNLRQHTNPNQLSSSIENSSIDFSDRQPFVEKLAGSLIDRLYELAKVREDQVKELIEMEKLVNKNDLGWQKALSLIEAFCDEEDEPSHFSPDSELDIVELEPSTPTITRSYSNFVPSTPSSILNSSLSTTTIRNELADLRDITSSLISALSTLNELAQVNQAASGESGRKLKSLKTHLGTVREEFSLFTRAEEFVKVYEEKETEIPVKERKGRFSSQARECMKEIEESLEEGWKKGNNIFKELEVV